MHEGGGRWIGNNKVVELKKKEKKKRKDGPRPTDGTGKCRLKISVGALS